MVFAMKDPKVERQQAEDKDIKDYPKPDIRSHLLPPVILCRGG
jgi:hypothetical protein